MTVFELLLASPLKVIFPFLTETQLALLCQLNSLTGAPLVIMSNVAPGSQ
ncbi:hypothetical protein [Arsenophonus endosymbiont of Aleurodicus floccissimus]|nr:hypothetical protein [Arsenophonus endosymbiont of Aleurodicus floccissimus]